LFCSAVCSGESILSGERTIVLPFASDPKTDRGFVDIPLAEKGIVHLAAGFKIDFECNRSDTIGNIVFYLHSKNGWYAYDFEPKKVFSETTKQFHYSGIISARPFRTEGKPEGFENVDTIRFSIWRPNQNVTQDATVKLQNIQIVPYSIYALLSESKEEIGTVNSFIDRLNRLNIPTGTISQSELTSNRLTGCKIFVLPLNSKLTTETITIIQSFVEQGGKLIAFYQLPPDLMKALGFESGQYLKSPQGSTALAKIRFEKEDPFGQINEMVQKSWNIITTKPLPLYHAEVAAWWYDNAGHRTQHPALLLSDRGAFFSHILTGEDNETKNRFLKILFTYFDPTFQHQNIVRRWESIFAVGDPRKRTDKQRTELETKILDELKRRNFELNANFFRNDADETEIRSVSARFLELYDILIELRQNAIRDYCASVPSKQPEFRAWWEHDGLGAYHGDWDRTMKELSETGFNAVISNLLWGGSAHYASDVIPRSKKFEQYGDQVEQAIKAGKKYGIEIHAWQVCYRLNGSPPEFIETMKNAGRTQKSVDGTVGDWLCPSHPDNIDLECRTFCELVRKYPDLTGIHFDYIRYPDGNHCYCDGCRERFETEIGCKVTKWSHDVRGKGIYADRFEQWRCDNITKLVERVHREAKQIRPNIKISAAVFSKFRRDLAQNWKVWVDRGYLDFVCPMSYTPKLDVFETLVEHQHELVNHRIPLYPGIGASYMTPDLIAAEIEIVRKKNLTGFIFFNLDQRTIKTIPPMLKLGATAQ
jgi:uncharacterized lipoprotein YddW (UPF0748 family)